MESCAYRKVLEGECKEIRGKWFFIDTKIKWAIKFQRYIECGYCMLWFGRILSLSSLWKSVIRKNYHLIIILHSVLDGLNAKAEIMKQARS